MPSQEGRIMLLRKTPPDRKRKWETFFFQTPVNYGEKRSMPMTALVLFEEKFWKQEAV